MKILRISSTFVPPWRGLGPGPFELTNAQVKLGHEVIVITKYSEGCLDFDRDLPYKVIRIRCRFDLQFSLKASILAWRLKQRFHYQVIHNHGFSALFTLFFQKIRLIRAPIISSVHIVRIAQFFNVNNVDYTNDQWKNDSEIKMKFIDYKKKYSRTLFFEKIYFRYSKLLLTVSDSLTQEIVYFYKRHAPIFPVYNGVNEEIFKSSNPSRTNKDKGFINFIFVGVLNERKGENDLIRACSKIKDKNFKIEIVGDGPNRESLMTRIKKLQLEDRIKLIKNLPHSELVDHLIKSDVFVLPSYSEGLPKVLLEAMMANNIILISDIKPHQGVINENTGILFKTGDSNDLSIKMKSIIENHQLYLPLASAAMDHVKKNYTWLKVAERVKFAYAQLF